MKEAQWKVEMMSCSCDKLRLLLAIYVLVTRLEDLLPPMYTRQCDVRRSLLKKNCFEQIRSALTIPLYLTFVGSGYSKTAQKQGTTECNSGKYS